MNYFRFHIGDYASATEHLSWDEDQAYTRLLRVYYRDERPIPADIGKACRLVRAQTKDQRAAVETVLQEFFTLEDDGWHQIRCDQDIADFKEFEGESEERKENERERQRRHRIERKRLFDELRKQGVMMPFNASTDALRSRLSSQTSHSPVTRDIPVTDAVLNMYGHGYPTPTPTPTPRLRGTRGLNGHEHPPTEKPKKPRAHRAPEGFEPTATDRAFAATEIPDLDIDRELARFRDWEFKTPHSDWHATWRNWVREAKQRGQYARANIHPAEPQWSRVT